jgi:hypothetical protein
MEPSDFHMDLTSRIARRTVARHRGKVIQRVIAPVVAQSFI